MRTTKGRLSVKNYRKNRKSFKATLYVEGQKTATVTAEHKDRYFNFIPTGPTSSKNHRQNAETLRDVKQFFKDRGLSLEDALQQLITEFVYEVDCSKGVVIGISKDEYQVIGPNRKLKNFIEKNGEKAVEFIQNIIDEQTARQAPILNYKTLEELGFKVYNKDDEQ